MFLAQLGSFDAVVCSEVLYYVHELQAALDRIRELINPGGYLLTSNIRHPQTPGCIGCSASVWISCRRSI